MKATTKQTWMLFCSTNFKLTPKRTKKKWRLIMGGLLKPKKNSGMSGLLKVTQTMLDKGIIDCNKSILDIALEHNINFKKKTEIKCILRSDPLDQETCRKRGDNNIILHDLNNDIETVMRFYTTKRGDKRLSIRGLNRYAKAGDVLSIYIHRMIYVYKVSLPSHAIKSCERK